MADTAVADERIGLLPARVARLAAALSDRLGAEGERRLLWLPVFFGAGIGIYFALRVEPPLWPGVTVAIGGAGVSFIFRRRPAWCEAALALTVFAAGFALMSQTAWERRVPMLQRRLGPVTVTGRVVDIDLAQNGWRIVVEPDPVAGLDPTGQPRRLRLHIPRTSDELNPGDRVQLKAMLYPVPPQILPGGRDFQRELYFAGIGLDRRGRLGADHRQARCHRGRGQAVFSRFRSVAPVGNRRAASGSRRRLCVLCRARRPGADPTGRLALSDQEDRCGSSAILLICRVFRDCLPRHATETATEKAFGSRRGRR